MAFRKKAPSYNPGQNISDKFWPGLLDTKFLCQVAPYGKSSITIF